jgi:hypothetical protein
MKFLPWAYTISLFLSLFSYASRDTTLGPAPVKIPKAGEFIGISPLLIRDGASLEDSYVSFSMDGDGVVIRPAKSSEESEQPKFGVHYSDRWIKDHGNCRAIKQNPKSNLASYIICFEDNGTKAEMILGEGMPATLGVYKKVRGDASKQKEALAQEYAEWRKKLGNPEKKTAANLNAWMSDLISIPKSLTVEKLKAMSEFERISTMYKVISNLWTGTKEEVESRMELIEAGLNDPSPKAQQKNIMQLQLSGRVTSMIDPIISLLEKPSSDEKVHVGSIRMACILLYEADRHNKDAAFIKKAFGTLDLNEIYKKTNGIVEAELEKPLFDYSWNRNRPTLTQWTVADETKIRAALEKLLPDSTAENCLKEYPDHYPPKEDGESIGLGIASP